MIDQQHAAPITQVSVRANGVPTDDELARINELHALVAQTKDSVFVFRMEISNDLLDSMSTRMDPETTLRNYRDDFREGRSIQNSHKVEELPLARSFDAALERRGRAVDPQDPERTAVMIKVYVPRGINLNGVASDELIRGIEAGIVKDGSVHFDDSARYVCSVCGGDQFERGSACTHMPGLTYNGKRAEALIVDGHAIEGSLVYDGSTPMAMIQKAERMAAAGALDARQVERLERLYRTRIRPRNTSHQEEPMKSKELSDAFTAGRQLGIRLARAASGLDSLDADTASQVQAELDKLAAIQDSHGQTLQLLGGVIGTGIGVYRMTGPEGLPDISQVSPVLQEIHASLVSQHDAYGEAIKSLQTALTTGGLPKSPLGMGAETGKKYGLPDTPATLNDMNDASNLSDFHGGYTVFGADPGYPAVPTVPSKVTAHAAKPYDPLDAFRTGVRVSSAAGEVETRSW